MKKYTLKTKSGTIIGNFTYDENDPIMLILEEDLSVQLSNEIPLSNYFCVRSSGKFKNKAYYLNKTYNWKLEPDDEIPGAYCLIPTKKI